MSTRMLTTTLCIVILATAIVQADLQEQLGGLDHSEIRIRSVPRLPVDPDGFADGSSIMPRRQGVPTLAPAHDPSDLPWRSTVPLLPLRAKALPAPLDRPAPIELPGLTDSPEVLGTHRLTEANEIDLRRAVLQLRIVGPHQVGLDEEAIYELQLTNANVLTATGVRVSAKIPEGLTVTVVDRPIEFLSRHNTIVWTLGVLPRQATQSLRMKLRADREGAHVVSPVVTADGTITMQTRYMIRVASPIAYQDQDRTAWLSGETPFADHRIRF